MNTLAYRISEQNGLSFELLVDGEPLAALVSAPDLEIPYWIIHNDLPTFPPGADGADPHIRIIAVCSCGEYGCGHTRCRVKRTDDDSVVLHDFDVVCSPEGRKQQFEFSRLNYDTVVGEIAELARKQQERDAWDRTS